MRIVGAHLLAVVTNKFHDCGFGYTGFLHHRDSGVAQRVEAQTCPRAVPYVVRLSGFRLSGVDAAGTNQSLACGHLLIEPGGLSCW